MLARRAWDRQDGGRLAVVARPAGEALGLGAQLGLVAEGPVGARDRVDGPLRAPMPERALSAAVVVVVRVCSSGGLAADIPAEAAQGQPFERFSVDGWEIEGQRFKGSSGPY